MIRSWFVDEDGKVPFSLSRVVKWDAILPEIQRALEGEEIYDIEETPNIFDGGSVKVTFWYKPVKEG